MTITTIAANSVHGLEVSVGAGVRSETWLNGILLARSEVGETGVESLAIQHDMVPGENLAEVRVGLAGMDLEQPAVPIPGAPPATASARLLLQIDEPRRLGDALEIATRDVDQVVWAPGEQDAQASVSLPHRLALTFTPSSPIVPPPWAGATRALPAGTPEAVYARMAQLAAMLRDGDLDAYQNAGALRREHMARSYPLGPSAQAAREHDLQALDEMRSEPGFTVMLLPRSEARFRTMGGGRLLDWVSGSGEPALSISSRSVPPSPVSMQFSLINGVLAMTR